MARKWLSQISVIALITAIYYFQTLPLSDWLVDDAGISFAYAKNLASGYGLVSQPGQIPVEGYSNPVWVFLLSVFALANIDIVTIVKTLSQGLSIMAMGMVFLTLCDLGLPLLYSLVAVGWLTCQPAFVIWSISGLENPLYSFLLATLFFTLARQQSRSTAAFSGILSGFISLTRPEGIIYGCIYPLFHRKHTKYYLPGFVPIFVFHLVFRIAYFGDLFPNPYYIKSEQFLSREWLTNAITKSEGLLISLFGGKSFVFPAFILFGLLILYLAWQRTVKKELYSIGVFLFVAIVGYIILPKDWMEEYRYATPVFLFAYPFIVSSVSIGMNSIPANKHAQTIGLGLLFVWWFLSYGIAFEARFDNFIHAPTVPMAGVASAFNRFEEYGRVLDLKQEISVLTPDVGGALYYFPNIHIYDLGGLVDPTISRTIGRDENALHDYIFRELPTFIHIHGEWAYMANLDVDQRFRTMYVPIYEFMDLHIREKYGVEIYSGDFVRRDLISSPEVLTELQKISPSWK
jgi:hypothetical protein